MIENISKLKNKELVKIIGEKVIGTPSGLEAQHAQAELNRRLINSINNLNKSNTNYSKRLLVLTLILFLVAITQLIISIFLSGIDLWTGLVIEVISLSFILYFSYSLSKEFIKSNENKK